MKNTLQIFTLATACLGLSVGESVMAQLSFTNSNNRLSVNSRSGCAVTVVDVNHDGLDDIVRLDQSNELHVDLQNRDGSFTNHFIVDIGGGNAWAMTVADVDKNGWKDVVADGSNGIRLIKLFENAGVITHTNTLLANSGFFLQNATFCDINNDGWIDLFGCDDNDESKMYLNDGAGNLLPSTLVSFAVNPGVTIGNDPADSGNYGSTWIDFDNDGDLDLYIAHCRQGVNNPSDLRRINRLFVNDGNNNFTEQATTFGIDIGWQSWTASFGDIDNDGDLDLLVTNHDANSQIFENDGSGYYTELLNTGINTTTITSIESVFEDFDNDGYIDILITGSEWLYYKNNGNKTFTRVTGLLASNGMLSFAIGDLNHDGFIDIFSSYGGIYNNPSNTWDDVLYLNDRNSNNFITFNLEGTISNHGAIGARVTIYGPWGIQVREVRAGESYGTCNSSQLHFGLGQATTVDSAVVWFPSGTTTTLPNLAANQFVLVVENGCVITDNFITGQSIICTGQSTTLTASPGFSSYLWSDGSTGQDLTVSTAGIYNVMVTDANGCSAISTNIEVLLNPDETPTVGVAGDLVFCEGESVTLTSTPAASYSWSDGSTTQSIAATQTGTYSVTIQGVCGLFTSTTIDVEVLAAPAPIGQGASGPLPSSVVLSATGNNLSWYDQQTGGTLLGTGPTYTTPVLSATTTYWVDATTVYTGAVNNSGMYTHQGTLYSGNTTNAVTYFSVNVPCRLVSVKVFTDTPGDRQIELRDGTTVLESLLASVPIDSSRITLNFDLVPGINYSLATNGTVNNTNFGFNSPRLQRSSQGVTYPYEIPDVLSITGNNQGGSWYYYFFDWEVKEPDFNCVSERVPVIADITTSLAQNPGAAGISLYPNPASNMVTIRVPGAGNTLVDLIDVTGRLIKTGEFNAGSEGIINLDLDNVAKGYYQLRIKNSEGETTKQLTVQ
jgi:hypothetical protein